MTIEQHLDKIKYPQMQGLVQELKNSCKTLDKEAPTLSEAIKMALNHFSLRHHIWLKIQLNISDNGEILAWLAFEIQDELVSANGLIFKKIYIAYEEVGNNILVTYDLAKLRNSTYFSAKIIGEIPTLVPSAKPILFL